MIDHEQKALRVLAELGSTAEDKALAARLRKALDSDSIGNIVAATERVQLELKRRSWAERLHPRDRGGRFSRVRGAAAHIAGRRPRSTSHEQVLAAPGGPVASTPARELPLFLGFDRTPNVRRELGSSRDTKEKYSTVKNGRLVYTRQRKQLHRRLVEKLFAEYDAKRQKPGDRQIVFVAGGPSSGKSSAESYMPQLPDSVEIDQDWFKKQLSEFRNLAKDKDPYASDSAHREAAELAHEAKLEAMRRGYNIVLQGTGDSSGEFTQKLQDAKQDGYRVHAFYVSAPTDVAVEREKPRAKKSGRKVPIEGMRAMHANVSRYFPSVLDVAPVLESLQLFDSREDTRKGGQARRMGHLDANGRFMIDDPQLYQEFLAKRHEDPGSFVQGPAYV